MNRFIINILTLVLFPVLVFVDWSATRRMKREMAELDAMIDELPARLEEWNQRYADIPTIPMSQRVSDHE